MQDLKMEDQIAGHENAGPENAGPSRNRAFVVPAAAFSCPAFIIFDRSSKFVHL